MGLAVTAAAGLTAEVVVRRGDGFSLDVDLSVPSGMTTALLGPNAAGKSTAIAAIAGLQPIDAGRITLGDRVLDEPCRGRFVPPEDRRLGVVLQDRILFGHLSVLQNVAFGPRSRGVPRREAVRVARGWLERLELLELADRRPGQLSGGQAQLVALCRALATAPAALLLDEPLSALDVTARVATRRLLATHLGGFPGPRLLVTHDPAEAFLLADLIHVVEDGVVTQTGTPDDLRLRPRSPYVADLAGTNLVRGMAAGAVVRTAAHVLQVAEDDLDGPVVLAINPRAVTVHRHEPQGSPRNRWRTVIELVEPLGDRARIQLGAPLPLMVEITARAVRELGLRARTEVWVAVKATEIAVTPEEP